MAAPALSPATGLFFSLSDLVPLLPYLRDAAGRAAADAMAADETAARCAHSASEAARTKSCFPPELAWAIAIYSLAETQALNAAQAAKAAAVKARRAAAHLHKIIRAVEELSCS